MNSLVRPTRAAGSGENSLSATPLLFEFFKVLMDVPAFPHGSQDAKSKDAQEKNAC